MIDYNVLFRNDLQYYIMYNSLEFIYNNISFMFLNNNNMELQIISV